MIPPFLGWGIVSAVTKGDEIRHIDGKLNLV
jgi:hypothetical protein